MTTRPAERSATSPSRNEITARRPSRQPRLREVTERDRRPRRPRRAGRGGPGGRGTVRAPSRTWALSAFPCPVTAIFTSSEPYSSTSRPASAAASRITPVALATIIALTWFLFQAIRSIATDAGRCDAIASRPRRGARAGGSASGRSAAVRTVSANSEHGLAVVPGDGGEAERGHARVDAEHARIEHLFSLWDAQSPVKHPQGMGETNHRPEGRAYRARASSRSSSPGE